MYFSLLPFPHLTFLDMRISHATAGVKASRVEVYPEILSLIGGKPRLRKVFLGSPSVELTLAEKKAKGKPLALKGLPTLVPPIEVKGGEVLIRKEGEEVPLFAARGLEGFLRLKTRDWQNWEVSLEGEGAEFSWREGRVRASRWALGIAKRKGCLWIKLGPIRLIEPRAKMTAWARTGAGRYALRLDLEGVRVKEVRKLLDPLRGRSKVLREIFDILRDGEVLQARCYSEGRSLHDLLKAENLWVRGEVRGLYLLLPAGRLPLEGICGRGEISGGILRGWGIEARMGDSVARKGRVAIGLLKEKDLLFVEAEVEVKAGDVIRYLPRLLKGSLAKELKEVKEARGGMRGRLLLQGRLSSPQPDIEISHMKVAFRYKDLPPISLRGGYLRWRQGSLRWEEISGKAGRSSLERCGGKISLRGKPILEVSSLRGVFHLEEIEDWLRKGGIALKVKGLRGLFRIEDLKLEASLKPWHLRSISFRGTPAGASFRHPSLPPLRLKGGEVAFDGHSISLKEVAFSTAGGGGTLSGKLSPFTFRGGENRLSGHLSVSPELAHWIYKRFRLPRALRPKPPYEVEALSLLHRGEEWSLSGLFSFPQGQRVEAELSAGARRLALRRLFFKGEKEATLSLLLSKGKLSLSFSGELRGGDVGQMLEENPLRRGSLKGRVEISFDLDRPLRSKAWGRLEVRDFSLPGYPAHITGLKLRGKGRVLMIEGAALKAPFGDLRLEGLLRAREGGFLLDMRLQARRLDVKKVEEFFKGFKGGASRGSEKGPSIKGKVNWEVEELVWGKFLGKDAKGTLLLGQRGSELKVSKIDICGIGGKGSLRWQRTRALSFKFEREEGNLSSSLCCLLGKCNLAEGKFDLVARVRASGRHNPLKENSTGEIRFLAWGGRIHRWEVLSRLLSLINFPELLRGRTGIKGEGLPFESITVKAKLRNGRLFLQEAVLDGPSLKAIGEGEIDLIKEEVDMTVLLAPMRTVDTVLNRIPLLGKVLTGKSGTFVSFPFRVKGSLSHPKITSLEPSAVGSGLLGVMKRMLQLPVQIIKPVLPQ